MKENKMTMWRMAGFVCLVSVLFGCEDSGDVEEYRAPKEIDSEPAMGTDPGTGMGTGMGQGMGQGTVPFDRPPEGQFTWVAPEGWQEAESPSAMRLASFGVPHGDEVGDLSIISLGGGAGGATANVIRWRGQVGLSPVSPAEIEASAITVQSPAGEFRYWRIANESDAAPAMLAAMLVSDERVLFVKLSGSGGLIAASEESFAQFLKGMSSGGEAGTTSGETEGGSS